MCLQAQFVGHGARFRPAVWHQMASDFRRRFLTCQHNDNVLVGADPLSALNCD